MRSTDDFLFIFIGGDPERHLEEEPKREDYRRAWEDWIGSLTQNGCWKFGSFLDKEGFIIGGGGRVRDFSPFDIDAAINGFALIAVGNLSDAADIAKRCPILRVGGKVEIRSLLAESGL